VFHQLIQQDKLEHQGHAVNFGVGQTISISVRRNYLYEDAFEKLSPDNGMSSTGTTFHSTSTALCLQNTLLCYFL